MIVKVGIKGHFPRLVKIIYQKPSAKVILKGKVLEEQKEYSKAIEAYKEAMKRTENKISLQYKIKSLEAKVNKK